MEALNANARAVLAMLQTRTDHPTAQEIYDEVRHVRPRIGLATVYRILHQLVEQGTIKTWDYSNTGTRYDAHISRHDHALCVECGALLDVPVVIPLPPEILEQAALAAGIEMETHEVRIYGRCQNCQRKRQA
jgi:Fur family peroxide stress response transcriptional regulator